MASQVIIFGLKFPELCAGDEGTSALNLYTLQLCKPILKGNGPENRVKWTCLGASVNAAVSKDGWRVLSNCEG